MQMKDPPRPPREMNPQVPEEIETLILKCLQKEPSARYASVGQLKAALEKAVHAPLGQPQVSVVRKVDRGTERLQN